MEYSFLILITLGAAGALIKDILQDNKIKLPKFADNEIALGSIGGMAIGAATGYLIDGNPATAFLAGYAGTGLIESLLIKKDEAFNGTKTTEEIIRKIAKEEGVDPELTVRVAKCESNLNYKAINTNTDGSRDRGLFQINEKWHPEISDEEALNPITATTFFCKSFKEGHLDWWNATRKCWEK